MSTAHLPPRTAASTARQALVWIAMVALALFLWQIRQVLVLAFGAMLFAIILRSFAGVLKRRLRLSDNLSLALVLLILISAITALGFAIGPAVVRQFDALGTELPGILNRVESFFRGHPLGRRFVSGGNTGVSGQFAATVLAAGTRIVGAVADLVIVIFAGIFFAFTPTYYRKGFLQLIPHNRRKRVDEVLQSVSESLRRWLVAQLIAMAAVGVLTFIALTIAGVPFALVLGLIAAVFDFVPFVGPIAASVPGITVALTEGVQTAVFAAVAYLIIQQLEGNIITPLVQKQRTQLPPVLVILSTVGAGLVLGIPGIIVATPLLVVGMTLVRKLYIEDVLGDEPQSSEPI